MGSFSFDKSTTTQTTPTTLVLAENTIATLSPSPTTTVDNQITSLASATAPYPSPTTTVTQEPLQTTIKTTRAWLRKGPALNHPYVKNEALNQGEKVEIISRTTNSWFFVQSSTGDEGWLYIEWLVTNFPVETVPLAEKTPTPPPPEPTTPPQKPDKPSNPSAISTSYP